MDGYYFVNPHGHTTRGIRWDGLHREDNLLSLQEVIDAANKEFDVSFDKLLLFPGPMGSFVLGVSEKISDQHLQTLSGLIAEMEEEYGNKEYGQYYIMADERGVVVFDDDIFA